MKSFIASALMLLVPALAVAQTPAKPEVKASAKPAAKPAKTAEKAPAAKKAAVAKSEGTSSRTQLKSAANQVASGIIAAEAALSPDELAIAERVHVGRIPCELGAFVTVSPEPASPGHFHIEGKGFKYFMAPVATTTGTVRLEDELLDVVSEGEYLPAGCKVVVSQLRGATIVVRRYHEEEEEK